MSEGHGSSMHFVEIRSEVEIITQMSQGSENEHACVYSCWRYIYIYIHIYVYIIHVGMYIYIYVHVILSLQSYSRLLQGTCSTTVFIVNQMQTAFERQSHARMQLQLLFLTAGFGLGGE